MSPTPGSDIDFHVTPGEIQNSVTDSMVMRCSLTSLDPAPMTSTPGTSLVGRSADDLLTLSPRQGHVKRTSGAPVKHVSSITISRNDEVVATVTAFTLPQVETPADLLNVKVTGDTTGNETENG